MAALHKADLPHPIGPGCEDGLTCIHRPIHCAAAGGRVNSEDELQQIEICQFIDALAEIALAVAQRREGFEP